ncbi:MAG: hypothetical protein JJU37_01825 [Balneolaceae bacterium]|nr:hypothetical protein [Balneolaceae bacterium]
MLLLFASKESRAQLSYSAESMALGGGGTAYLTGFEALFVNPANLFVQEKNYNYQLSFLQTGYYFDSLQPVSGTKSRFNQYVDHLAPYSTELNLAVTNREDLLDRSFNENRSTAEFLNQTEINWFGIKWVRPEKNFALAARTRIGSRYRLGKGLYSATPLERDNSFLINQSFTQQYQVLHEISFGYAESFTFLNGLTPGLSEFIVGIAPKIVVPGGYLDVNYRNRYQLDPQSGLWENEIAYNQRSTGVLTDRAENFFFPQINPENPDYGMRDLMRPNGIGFGIDAGITYLITFGDDLSVLRQEDEPTEKSLRISLSITDIGIVYQNNSPFEYDIENQVFEENQTGTITDFLFQGAPNEHYSFLSDYFDPAAFQTFSVSEQPIEVLLPASIQAGALFQYNRLKLMGDISYTIVDNAFKPSGIMGFAGLEIKPLSFLPLRAGTRLAPGLPGYFSLGSGIETNRFDINAAFQLKSRRGGPTSEILGASVIGLKLYI